MSKGLVFISYSSKDRPFVLRLADDIKAAGYDIWLDQWNITGREAYWDEIQHGIERADYFIFVITPHSVLRTCAARRELHHADMLKRPLIVPVMASETPYADLPLVITPGEYQIHNLYDDYEKGLARVLVALSPDSRPDFGQIKKPPPPQPIEQRKFEAAMPRHTLQGRATEVRVKIALLDSAGLRGELPDFTEAGDLINREDVQASGFPIEYPRDDKTGEILPARVCLAIRATGFDILNLHDGAGAACEADQIEILLRQGYDSRTVILTLEPHDQAKIGRARVFLTLYYLGEVIAQAAVATEIISEPVRSAAGWSFQEATLAAVAEADYGAAFAPFELADELEESESLEGTPPPPYPNESDISPIDRKYGAPAPAQPAPAALPEPQPVPVQPVPAELALVALPKPMLELDQLDQKDIVEWLLKQEQKVIEFERDEMLIWLLKQEQKVIELEQEREWLMNKQREERKMFHQRMSELEQSKNRQMMRRGSPRWLPCLVALGFLIGVALLIYILMELL